MLQILFLCLILQNNATPEDTSPKTHKTQNQIVQKITFLNDPLLSSKITIREKEATHAFLWKRLRENTGLLIEREESVADLDNAQIVVYCEKSSVRSVMDALAARILARWEKIPKGYLFLVSSKELESVYKPKTLLQRDIYRKGMEMVSLIKQLPQDVRQQLNAGEAVPFGSFSPEMQNLQRDLVRLSVKESLMGEPEGTRTSFCTDDFSDATIKIIDENAKGFDCYGITINKASAGQIYHSVNNFEQRMEEGGIAGTNADKYAIYAPKKYELSREDALKTSLLKQRISLKMQEARLPQVLIKLHEKYGVNFMSDAYSTFPQKANINFDQITLGEALNKLMELYPKTEWELRKSRFLIFRSPQNIVHDPSTEHDIPEAIQPNKP